MREPALERVADEIMLLPAREGLDQDLVGAGHDRELGLQPQPVARPGRAAAASCAGSASMLAHPLGEIGRERELAAFIGRDLRARSHARA